MSFLDNLLDSNPQFKNMINSISTAPEQGLALDTIIYRLLAACLIGGLIGQVYRRTHTGIKFSPSLPDTHMLLCLGGALIWLVVGNNLVRAFGLAGTIGLIRYRTVVQDPKDTPILLFSMVLGMTCGLGQFRVAFAGIAVILGALTWLHFSHRRLRAKQIKDSSELVDLFGDDNKRTDKDKSDAHH